MSMQNKDNIKPGQGQGGQKKPGFDQTQKDKGRTGGTTGGQTGGTSGGSKSY